MWAGLSLCLNISGQQFRIFSAISDDNHTSSHPLPGFLDEKAHNLKLVLCEKTSNPERTRIIFAFLFFP